MVMILSAFVVNAVNYTVTVKTQKQIEYREVDSDKLVEGTTEMGQTLTFDVVANTPYDAEQIALSRCSTACKSHTEEIEAKNVKRNGKLCHRYVKTVPFSAEAKENTKTSY